MLIDYIFRGTVHYLSLGAYAGIHPGNSDNAQAGVLQDEELECDDNGKVLLWLSCQPPPKNSGRWNWLRLAPNTERLIIRQSYMNRDVEQAADLQLERIVPFVKDYSKELPKYMINQRAAATWNITELRSLLKNAG
jgi:hypothetical protein